MKRTNSKNQPNKKGWHLFTEEFTKNLRITIHGPTKAFCVLGILIPLIFMLFIFLGTSTATKSYNIAIVVSGYSSDATLDADLAAGKLPYTEQFIDTFNHTVNGSKSLISVGCSLNQFLDAFHNQNIDLIIVLPAGFEQAIADDKANNWTGGDVNVDIYISNLNEDFTEVIEHNIDSDLNTYYNTVLVNNVKATFTESPINPNQTTLPQLWSLGSTSLEYGLLVVSIIIGAAYIFNEKQARMLPQLALTSSQNQMLTFTGKFLAGLIFPLAIDFPAILILVILFTQVPVGVGLLVIIGVAILTILFGIAIGMLIGAAIPELVYTIPLAVFLVLAAIFMCGGFQDIRTFPVIYQFVMSFVPFTYCFSLMNVAMLAVGTWNWLYFLGLILYIGLFFFLGFKVFQKRIIRGQN